MDGELRLQVLEAHKGTPGAARHKPEDDTSDDQPGQCTDTIRLHQSPEDSPSQPGSQQSDASSKACEPLRSFACASIQAPLAYRDSLPGVWQLRPYPRILNLLTLGVRDVEQHSLEEQPLLPCVQRLDDVPEGLNHRMLVVVSPTVYCIRAQVVHVGGLLGAGDEDPQLLFVEELDPLRVDHLGEALLERRALPPDLRGVGK